MKILSQRYILYLFILSSLLLILDIFLYLNYKISFAGFYTDCVVFWVWILSFLGIIIAYWKKLVAKISLGIFVLGIVGSLIPMGIPFFGLVIFATGDNHYKTNLNDRYRVQITNYSIIGIPHCFLVENKYFFFEKEVAELPIDWRGLEDVSLIKEDRNFLYIKVKYIEKDEYYKEKEVITYEKIKK